MLQRRIGSAWESVNVTDLQPGDVVRHDHTPGAELIVHAGPGTDLSGNRFVVTYPLGWSGERTARIEGGLVRGYSWER